MVFINDCKLAIKLAVKLAIKSVFQGNVFIFENKR